MKRSRIASLYVDREVRVRLRSVLVMGCDCGMAMGGGPSDRMRHRIIWSMISVGRIGRWEPRDVPMVVAITV